VKKKLHKSKEYILFNIMIIMSPEKMRKYQGNGDRMAAKWWKNGGRGRFQLIFIDLKRSSLCIVHTQV